MRDILSDMRERFSRREEGSQDYRDEPLDDYDLYRDYGDDDPDVTDDFDLYGGYDSRYVVEDDLDDEYDERQLSRESEHDWDGNRRYRHADRIGFGVVRRLVADPESRAKASRYARMGAWVTAYTAVPYTAFEIGKMGHGPDSLIEPTKGLGAFDAPIEAWKPVVSGIGKVVGFFF